MSLPTENKKTSPECDDVDCTKMICLCKSNIWPGYYIDIFEEDNGCELPSMYTRLIYCLQQDKSVLINGYNYDTYTYYPNPNNTAPNPSTGYIHVYLRGLADPLHIPFTLPKVPMSPADLKTPSETLDKQLKNLPMTTLLRMRFNKAPKTGTFHNKVENTFASVIMEIEYVKRSRPDGNYLNDFLMEWYVYDFKKITISCSDRTQPEPEKKKRKKRKKKPKPAPAPVLAPSPIYIPPHKRNITIMEKMVSDLVDNDHVKDQGCQTETSMLHYESWYDNESLIAIDDLYPPPKLDLHELVMCEELIGPMSDHYLDYNFDYQI
jgi:hypothetical protein